MTLRPTVLDLSPSARIDSPVLSASLARALRFAGQLAAASDRFDSTGSVGGAGTLDAYHRHVDGEVMRELGRNWRPPSALVDLAQRSDALPAGAGGFPRDFEFARTRVFEEARQPLTGMTLFPIDTEVPLGARSYRSRRALGAGEAQIYRGGNEFPRARSTYVEDTHGIVYVVCSVEQNFIESLTLDWAGLQQYTRDLRLANRLVEERINRILWHGDPASAVYGILNYPGVAQTTLAIAISDASVSEDVASAIQDFIATPTIVSAGVFSGTVLAVSPRINQFLFTRKHSTTGGSDLTIGQFILAGQAAGGGQINRFVVAPELAGVGPSGEDAMVLMRDDRDTVSHVMPQAPTTLPVYQSSVMDQQTVVFAATGGIDAADIGNVYIAYVEVSPTYGA